MARSTISSLLLVFAFITPRSAAAVTIPTVPVGNAGNVADATGYGAVAYDYRIATTEVTNAQYAEFLNAKAKSDPLALYNPSMGIAGRSGITRSGSDGAYSYALKTNMADKPVNFVSWYDAIRFVNWLHNGQGSGDTETGAYTLLGGTPAPSNGDSITRNPGAKWWLPSENEWYKAAYYQPTADGGDADDYWLYPTRSNTAPGIATADSAGNVSNPGANVANIFQGADWNNLNGNVTTVGSAGPLSNSFYGVADLAGNVMEKLEDMTGGGHRVARGGNHIDEYYLAAPGTRTHIFETTETFKVGFRVASVPEPSTIALTVVAFVVLAYWRQCKADIGRRLS